LAIMARRDVIVIGASAGGVAALTNLVKGLPADLGAAVFVVMHVRPYTPSALPRILAEAGPLEAVHAEDRGRFRPGRIYIAPPDKHMLLEAGRLAVRRGPKENRFRPSIDALFRSAAYVYGPRAIGVVLSGALDDGTSGLWSIKRLGGVAVVQTPADAQHPQMPHNVLEHVEADHVCPAAEMGPLLARLAAEDAPEAPPVDGDELRRLALEVDIATRDDAFEKGVFDWGQMAPYTCPECHGALVRLQEGPVLRYRCHTGHAFTPSALLAGVTEAVEETLWQAMRAMEEQAMLLEHMAKHFDGSGQKRAAGVFMEKSRSARDRARVIHDSLPEHEQISGDIELE
jgi:two-component system, chemotaxis family, protein-glutamate methylesterase/glutaminase